MEAMSIERLLLAGWEEQGFIGRNRVPIGDSDIDALAINVHERRVRIGESKVRMGSQAVFVVDDHHLEQMESGEEGFAWWLEGWSGWLDVLPKIWSNSGAPCVPWLVPVDEIRVIDVVFCCNLHTVCDAASASAMLRRAVVTHLSKNAAFARRLRRLTVNAELFTTVDILFFLARGVTKRIEEEGYGRRFGDPFKDAIRELHRYLRPQLDRIPCDAGGTRRGSRKEPFAAKLRRDTALNLLDSLGVSAHEIESWFCSQGGKRRC